MTEVADHTHTFVSVCVRSLVTVASKSSLKSLTIRLHASLQWHARGKDLKEKVVHSSFKVKTEDEICAERQLGECKRNMAESLYAFPS